MSPDDTPPAKPVTSKDQENQLGSSSSRKTASSSSRPQTEQGLKCPRCDSPNTKFCYYNNYSLTQPRHFCKTCRRYWTKGGALRNVPIGGGCRKNKKVNKSSSRLSSCDHSAGSSSNSDQLGGLKFLHGLVPSSMDFHLGSGLPFPRLLHHTPNTTLYNQFPSFGDTTSSAAPVTSAASCLNLDPSIGLNYPFSSSPSGFSGAIQQGMGSMNVHSSLASSIESLSSMNQDMHWKLQQQRLAMLFGGGSENLQKESGVDQNHHQEAQQKPQPILFQNLEINSSKPDHHMLMNSRKEGPSGGDTPTEWFFGNSYANSVPPTPTTSTGAGHGNDNNANNWGWGDVQQQYSALP